MEKFCFSASLDLYARVGCNVTLLLYNTKEVNVIKPFKRYQQILICVLPFLVIPLGLLASKLIIINIPFPPCGFYEVLGWICPGCGSTRAVAALLKGNILLSMRENFLIFYVIVVAVILYIELIFVAFGKKFRSPVRNYYFLWGSLALAIIYIVARNFIPAIAPVPLY